MVSSALTSIGLFEVFSEGDGAVQKCYIRNESNRSNFLSITKFKVEDGKRIDLSKLDIGDTYVSYCSYEGNVKTYERRYNRNKGTIFKMERIASNANGDIFVIDYDGQKTLTFNIKNIKENDRIK